MLIEELIELANKICKQKAEEQTIELKSAQTGCPKRLYDTLSSFSNQDSGGILVFGIDEDAAFFAMVHDPLVRNVIFHVGAGKLIHARTHRHAAVVDIPFPIFHIQRQGHVSAFHILAQRLCDAVCEFDAGQMPVHFNDDAGKIRSLQLKDQLCLHKHTALIQNLHVL